MYVCMYVCMYIYIYIYIHARLSRRRTRRFVLRSRPVFLAKGQTSEQLRSMTSNTFCPRGSVLP